MLVMEGYTSPAPCAEPIQRRSVDPQRGTKSIGSRVLDLVDAESIKPADGAKGFWLVDRPCHQVDGRCGVLAQALDDDCGLCVRALETEPSPTVKGARNDSQKARIGIDGLNVDAVPLYIVG